MSLSYVRWGVYSFKDLRKISNHAEKVYNVTQIFQNIRIPKEVCISWKVAMKQATSFLVRVVNLKEPYKIFILQFYKLGKLLKSSTRQEMSSKINKMRCKLQVAKKGKLPKCKAKSPILITKANHHNGGQDRQNLIQKGKSLNSTSLQGKLPQYEAKSPK